MFKYLTLLQIVTLVSCSHFNQKYPAKKSLISATTADSSEKPAAKKEDMKWANKMQKALTKKGYDLYQKDGHHFATKGKKTFIFLEGHVYRKVK